MTKHVEYLGFRSYGDTGEPFRSWKINDTVHINGKTYPAPCYLIEAAPTPEGHRFGVKARTTPHGDIEWVAGFDDPARAAQVLGFKVPAWPALPHVLAALREGGRLGRAVVSLLEAATGDPPGKTETPAADPPGQRNEHLKLRTVGQYSDGDRYRDWELLHDAPEIGGRAGDVLREEDDSDATPFRLRRGGRQIGSPEWWQVRHLFEGLAPWYSDAGTEGGEEAEASEDPALRRLRRAFPGKRPWGVVIEVTAPIPAAGLEPGDLLVYSTAYHRAADRLRCGVRRIPRQAFGDVAAAAAAWRVVYATPCYEMRGAAAWLVGRLEHALKNKRLLAASAASSPLRLLILPNERVSEPVRAKSDEGAIFELLAEVGCRMPEVH